MFARTIRMMELGIKPVWVFDGKPPDMKGGEIAKRQAAKKKAQADLKAAEAAGDVEAQNKFSKRNIRVGTKENDDVKLLFSLMGVSAPFAARRKTLHEAKPRQDDSGTEACIPRPLEGSSLRF